MRPSALCALLFTSVISVVRSTPVPRDNDGSRPITWISADGNQRCWQVDNGNIQANQILVVADCDGSEAQRFVYNTGATAIQVADTNFCVEFGPGLGVNGRPLRIQTCRQNGAPGQRLFITDDNHVALQNGPGQCADVTDGGDSAQLQSWRCDADNINQIFFGQRPAPPPPTPPLPPPLLAGATISPLDDNSRCLGPRDGVFDGDTPVAFPLCEDIVSAAAKRWFALGRLGLIMRQNPESVEGYLLTTTPRPTFDPSVYLEPYYGGPYIRLDAAFVAEYGIGDFAEGARLRNFGSNDPDLCLQAPDIFEVPEGLQEPFMAVCDASISRQASSAQTR